MIVVAGDAYTGLHKTLLRWRKVEHAKADKLLKQWSHGVIKLERYGCASNEPRMQHTAHLLLVVAVIKTERQISDASEVPTNHFGA